MTLDSVRCVCVMDWTVGIGSQSEGDALVAANKTIRWLSILVLLETEDRWWSTSEIHQYLKDRLSKQGMKHSLRTTQRDMAEIRESGLVELGEYTGEDTGGRWRLIDSELSLDRKRFSSPDMALILLLAGRHLAPLLPLDVQERLNELAQRSEAHFQSRYTSAHWVRPWQSKVRIQPMGHPLSQPKVDTRIVEEIYKALDQHKKLQLSYFQPGQPVYAAIYQPLGLVYRPPLFYLVVLRDGNTNPHNLALHRISEAELLVDDSIAPREFDLDNYIEESGTSKVFEKNVTLEIATNSGLCDHWEAACLGRDQSIERNDQGGKIKVTVHDTDALRRYLLGMGSQIQVLAPVSIKEWLHSEATKMIASTNPGTIPI